MKYKNEMKYKNGFPNTLGPHHYLDTAFEIIDFQFIRRIHPPNADFIDVQPPDLVVGPLGELVVPEVQVHPDFSFHPLHFHIVPLAVINLEFGWKI